MINIIHLNQNLKKKCQSLGRFLRYNTPSATLVGIRYSKTNFFLIKILQGDGYFKEYTAMIKKSYYGQGLAKLKKLSVISSVMNISS